VIASFVATLAQGADAVERIDTPTIDWWALSPILVMIGGAMVLLVLDALSLKKAGPTIHTLFTVLVAGAAIVAATALWQDVRDPEQGPFSILQGALGIDAFSVFFFVLLPVAVILAALFADGYLRREQLEGPELYVLMLLSASGGMVMAAADDLIVVFLGLEILSLAVYVLAAMHRRRVQSQEGALKYFVLGAFSSAFFLYGIALVYGATGTTRLAGIAAFVGPAEGAFGDTVTSGQMLSGPSAPVFLLAGVALLLVGFGFKVAAVPFHSWAPDVYQGSPTPVVAYMASGVKAAGFAGLLRVLHLGFADHVDDWQPIVGGLAVASLIGGAVLAIVQTDVKRLLAYSSISHAGFILVGVHAATERGISASLFYLAAYTFMVAGSFGVVTVLSRTGDGATSLDDYRGLAKRRPGLALLLAFFLLAQLGAPFTSGFVAKVEVLSAAADADFYWLALVAMLAAVIGAYLYLKVVVVMYMSADDEPAGTGAGVDHIPFAAKLGLAVCAGVTLLWGIFPGLLDDRTTGAVPVSAPAETDQ
jgi:NADH-quinone oxidoreductase subunit N